MRGTYGIFILFVFTAAYVVHAQTSLKDITGFGPCSQCNLLGNAQVLVPCSQMWRDLLKTCSTPECAKSMSEVSGPVFNIDSCTATPPPLPGGTSIFSWPGSHQSLTPDSGMPTTTTRTSNPAITTTAASTSVTASVVPQSSNATPTEVSTSSTSTASPTTSPTASPTTNTGTTDNTQTAGAAIGVAPGWTEGLVFLAGWVFAL